MTGPLRVGNCSGFYGDRLSAMREIVEGGVDVVTGDYLAELTMLILGRDAMKDPTAGYARTCAANAPWSSFRCGRSTGTLTDQVALGCSRGPLGPT